MVELPTNHPVIVYALLRLLLQVSKWIINTLEM